MKKSAIILPLFLLLISPALPQQQGSLYHSEFERTTFENPNADVLSLLLAADADIDYNKYTGIGEDLYDLSSKLKTIQERTDDDLVFLEKLFYKVHRKKLGWYENYVTMGALFDEGTYDCLTGTALYALILDTLQIKYTILEFDFHLFLTVHVGGHQILIEATDPYDGFLTDATEIQKRINSAVKSESVKEDVQKTFLRNSISLTALAGLQYYNLAVNHFNKGNYTQAERFIQKADLLYPSERIRNVRHMIASSYP